MKELTVPLSKRLSAIVSMVPATSLVVDIGTDHAYVPIALIKSQRCKRAIAGDIAEGPLSVASMHTEDFGVSDLVTCVLSDGLNDGKIRQSIVENTEEDTVLVLSGMGGMLIEQILDEGEAYAALCKTFILAPQSDVGYVRRFLCERGYCIVDERMIEEDGKYYPIMRVESGPMDLTEVEELYGPVLLRTMEPAFVRFLENRRDTLRLIEDTLRENGVIDEEKAREAKELDRLLQKGDKP